MGKTYRDLRRIELIKFWKEYKEGRHWWHRSNWEQYHDETWRIWPYIRKRYSIRNETRSYQKMLQEEIIEETGYLVQWRRRPGGYLEPYYGLSA